MPNGFVFPVPISFSLSSSLHRLLPASPHLCYPVIAAATLAAFSPSLAAIRSFSLAVLRQRFSALINIGIQGRGKSASPHQLQEVECAVKVLEGFEGVPEPTNSDLIEGRWQLMFTTRPGTASPIQVDIWGLNFLFLPFEWIGMNATLVYVMAAEGIFAGFINGWYSDDPHNTLIYWIKKHIFIGVWHSERVGILLYVIFAEILFWGIISGVLHSQGMYWKL